MSVLVLSVSLRPVVVVVIIVVVAGDSSWLTSINMQIHRQVSLSLLNSLLKMKPIIHRPRRLRYTQLTVAEGGSLALTRSDSRSRSRRSSTSAGNKFAIINVKHAPSSYSATCHSPQSGPPIKPPTGGCRWSDPPPGNHSRRSHIVSYLGHTLLSFFFFSFFFCGINDEHDDERRRIPRYARAHINMFLRV